MGPHPIGRKAAIRTHILGARRPAPGSATRVQAALIDLVLSRRPATVAAHVPFGAEPGGPTLPVVLATALAPAGRLLLPVVRDDLDLDWGDYDEPLVPGRWGSAEPPGPRLGPAAVAGACLVVVPAVAVDRRGVRLGRGGGSYDRALARVSSGTPVIALLHDGELLDEDLPAEPHDRPVTAVITARLGLVMLPVPV